MINKFKTMMVALNSIAIKRDVSDCVDFPMVTSYVLEKVVEISTVHIPHDDTCLDIEGGPLFGNQEVNCDKSMDTQKTSFLC